MSQYRGNSDQCRGCGITYGKFRTGLTYNEVHKMLWDTSQDSKEWKYKRRGTILGFWHSIKKDLWERHVDECFQTDAGGIPF